MEDHLSKEFNDWAASASPPAQPLDAPVLLTHYRLEYDTQPAVEDEFSEVSVSPISKRELRRAARRANRKAAKNNDSISAVDDAFTRGITTENSTTADGSSEDYHSELSSELAPDATELINTSPDDADAVTATSYDEWVAESMDAPTDDSHVLLDEPLQPAPTPQRRYSKKVSNILLVGACCLVTFGLVVLRSSGSAPAPTPPPPPPTTIPALSLSGAGWQVPEASLTLQPFMPSVAALRTQVSSLLEISAEGPLPLDQSIDAASATLFPDVLAGFSRSFANPSEESLLTVTALAYVSAASAEKAVLALADQLGTTSLSYRAPSPPGLSFPQGDDLVLATSSESGEGASTVVLRRQQVVFIATSRVSLASALAAVAASNALVSQSMTPRESSIGAQRPWTPSGTLDVSRPPLAPSVPLMNLHYPIISSDLCLGRDDLGVWSKVRCNLRTPLPFDASAQPVSSGTTLSGLETSPASSVPAVESSAPAPSQAP